MEEKIVDITTNNQGNTELQLSIYGLSLTATEVARINKSFLRYTRKRQEVLEMQAQIQQLIEEMIHENNSTQSEFESIITQKWIDMIIKNNPSYIKKEGIPNIIEQSSGKLSIILDDGGNIKPILRGDIVGKES